MRFVRRRMRRGPTGRCGGTTTIGLLLRSLGVLRPFWHMQVLGLAASFVSAVCALAYPWVQKLLIDDAVAQKDLHMLGMVLVLLGSSGFVYTVADVLRNLAFTYGGDLAIAALRKNCLRRLRDYPLTQLGQERTGKLMAIFTSDIPTMGDIYRSLLADFILGLLRLGAAFFALARISLSLTLACLPFVPVFAIVPLLFGPVVRRASRSVQETAASMSDALQEGIGATREVRAFTMENWLEGRIASIFWRAVRTRLRQVSCQSLAFGSSSLIYWTGLVLAFWIGGRRVIAGELTIGTLVAFGGYLGLLFGPSSQLAGFGNRIQACLAAAERVFFFLDAPPAAGDRSGIVVAAPFRGSIEFRQVCFSYVGSREALHDVSLVVEPGERLALVGPSGSGKSTLVGLLLRFYEVSVGCILLDGVDLRELRIESLRRQIGVVFQDPFILAASIRENIRFGADEATDSEIEAAAMAANAHEFIIALPRGYETEVGERGFALSGGQRQRLAIARAVLRNPKILILDEATSSVDTESEAEIRGALEHLLPGRTSLVITHRLSSVMGADRIAVLDNGRLVDVGRHGELLGRCPLYVHLCGDARRPEHIHRAETRKRGLS